LVRKVPKKYPKISDILKVRSSGRQAALVRHHLEEKKGSWFWLKKGLYRVSGVLGVVLGNSLHLYVLRGDLLVY